MLKWKWYDWVRDICNAALAVALMLLSIRYSGILTDFYSRLTGFGISEVREDRRGADPGVNELWMKRIRGSKDPSIIGTLSRGWFVAANENLDHLFENDQKVKLEVLLLDPFGKVWRSRVDTEEAFEKVLHETTVVFWNLKELMEKHPGRLMLKLYDSEPISCVLARGAIYLGLYLPQTSRKDVPEFTISTGSFLGKQVEESIKKIREKSPMVSGQDLEKYRETMVKYSSSSSEAFWSDPDVFCDFCKETRGLPSEFSRRFPGCDRRLIEYGEHLLLAPSLGQLAPDHILILSKQHLTSSAQLGGAALKEIAGLFKKLQSDIGENKKILFFEHGVPVEGSAYGGCGICHCHVHALSVPSGVATANKLETFLSAKKCFFSRNDVDEWSDITRFAKDSYLSVQEGDQRPSVFLFQQGVRVPSQLMRQFVAEECLQKKDWDWRSMDDDLEDIQRACQPLQKLRERNV
ncbi:MAG TPA: hypothetical protein VF773_02150 [Verrucomicrobiae bacterium]